MTDLKEISSSKCFNGYQKVFEHSSQELGCKMKFSIFLPSIVTESPTTKLPVVYFLSGLTCTEQNMITKSGIQRFAEQYKLIIVGPDTSPRGCNIPGEDEVIDLGTGAGFYVDATEEPWSKNYRMYSYVTIELRKLIDDSFSCVDGSRVGITGHSMGGHGALICFLKNPTVYKAVSAFAPISNLLNSRWGRRCMSHYLGQNEAKWMKYDATELVKRQPRKDVKILIDQGGSDEWVTYLVPQNFVKACQEVGQPLEFNEREGYDHGYYFVSTFIEEHMKYFSNILHFE